MGKDESSLQESRQIREMLKERWGQIPSSVMKADWSIPVIDFSHSYQDQKEASKFGADSPFSLSGVGARHGALSRMPQNIVHFACQFWTPEKLSEPGYFRNYLPTIVDPTCGHNSRLEAIFRCNRNYVGIDVSKNFMQMNRKVVMQLYDENRASLFPIEAKIELYEADSRDMLDYIPEESMDFCITSPPFYDLELDSYGDEPEQLGRQKSYSDFLYSLGRVIENCYKVLKPNSFIALEFNDFRREGIFHTFHADGMRLFEKAGFILWDVIVIDYGSGFLQSFAQDIEVGKIVSKEHSYLVVGRKMPKKVKRVKVRERLLEEVKETKPEVSLAPQPKLFNEGLPDI